MINSAELRRRNSTTGEDRGQVSAYGLPLVVSPDGNVVRGRGYVSPGATAAHDNVLGLERREGVYVILISPTGEIAVLPALQENKGKSEAIGLYGKLRDISDNSGTVSGGIKKGESPLDAVQREVTEEIPGLVVSPYQCSNSLRRLIVNQKRPDKNNPTVVRKVLFEVHGWKVLLEESQLQALIDFGAQLFSPTVLLEKLSTGEIVLRPSFEEAILQNQDKL